jgi:hypothetical protein
MLTSLGRPLVAVGTVEVIAVALVLVIPLAAAIVKALTETTAHRPVRRYDPRDPERFSYWYALVPFEDTSGAKERPVLVLRHDGTRADVLKVTSKAKPGRTHYRKVDTSRWARPGRANGSWLQTGEVVTIPLTNFRRHLGDETNTMFTRELVRIHPEVFR